LAQGSAARGRMARALARWAVCALFLAHAAHAAPAGRVDPALEAARAELAQDAILQKTLVAQRVDAQQEVANLTLVSASLRTRLAGTTAELNATRAHAEELEQELAAERGRTGELAAARGAAELQLRSLAASAARQRTAAAASAALLHRAAATQTAEAARGARLEVHLRDVQAEHGAAADASAASWREHAAAVEAGLRAQSDQARALETANAELRTTAAVAQHVREMAVSGLRSAVRQNQELKVEVKDLREQARSTSQRDATKAVTYDQEERAHTGLTKQLRDARDEITRLRRENAEAAGTIRTLHEQLRFKKRDARASKATPRAPRALLRRANLPADRHYRED